MATGFIGSSSATSNGPPTPGAVLSYTCPGSGVRYAVVTATARIYSSGPVAASHGNVFAGRLYWFPTTGSDIYKESIYTTILGPGQNWSEGTSATISSGVVSVYLSASVLEVA